MRPKERKASLNEEPLLVNSFVWSDTLTSSANQTKRRRRGYLIAYLLLLCQQLCSVAEKARP